MRQSGIFSKFLMATTFFCFLCGDLLQAQGVLAGFSKITGSEGSVVGSGKGVIWGANAARNVFFREGVSATTPMGTKWVSIDGLVTQVAVGAHGQLWALGIESVPGGYKVFRRTGINKDNLLGSGWEVVPGGLVSIAVGPNGEVWGANDKSPDSNGGYIFFRSGITASNPSGTDWRVIQGAAKQVVIGSEGQVFHVANDGGVWYRTGISGDKPDGTGWRQLDGKLYQLAIGAEGQLWGLGYNVDGNGNRDILFRRDATRDNPLGTGWGVDKQERLAYLSAGPSGAVWGMYSNGGILVREGITPSNRNGTGWKSIEGLLSTIAVGPIPDVTSAPSSTPVQDLGIGSDKGVLWGANGARNVFFREGISATNSMGTKWLTIDGLVVQIAVGAHGQVWALGNETVPGGYKIFRRVGITKDNPMGSSWELVSGGLVSIAVGPNGEVWGANDKSPDPNGGVIFFRAGISASNPNGTDWRGIPGAAKQVVIGPEGQVFHVCNDGGVWYRTGVAGNIPEGTGWKQLDGKLYQLAIGAEGQLWGLGIDVDGNGNRTIFFRTGVTKENPLGAGWDSDKQERMAYIAAGPSGAVWGMYSNGVIWTREGITSSNRIGTGWKSIDGLLTTIAVGPMPGLLTAQPPVVSQQPPVPAQPSATSQPPVTPPDGGAVLLYGKHQQLWSVQNERPTGICKDSDSGKASNWALDSIVFRGASGQVILEKPVLFGDIVTIMWTKDAGTPSGDNYLFTFQRFETGSEKLGDNPSFYQFQILDKNGNATGTVVKRGDFFKLRSMRHDRFLTTSEKLTIFSDDHGFYDLFLATPEPPVTPPSATTPQPPATGSERDAAIKTKSKVAVGFDGRVWALSDEDVEGGQRIYFREGVTKDVPKGTGWILVDGGLVNIAVGLDGQLWGVNSYKGIFFRDGITNNNPKGSGWIGIDGLAVQIAVGVDGQVWVLGNEDVAGGKKIYFREGITKDKPQGTSWTLVSGGLANIAVGQDGQLWGANDKGGIFFREGITKENPKGSDWQGVDGLAYQVAIGANGQVWHLPLVPDGNGNRDIYYRDGVTKDNPKGSSWKRLDEGKDSRQAILSVGANGQIWGVLSAASDPDLNGSLWFREGITTAAPAGTIWTKIEKPSVDKQIKRIDAELKTVEHLPFGFVKVPGAVKKVAVGLRTDTVKGKKIEELDRWAIDMNGKLLVGSGASGEWAAYVAKDDKGVELPGFIDISVGGDGTVYAIATDGNVYCYTRKGEKVTAAPSEVKEDVKKENKAKKAELRATKKAKKLGRTPVKKATKKVAKKKTTKKKVVKKKAATTKAVAKKQTATKKTAQKTTPKKVIAKKTTENKDEVEKKSEDKEKKEEKKSSEKTVDKTTEKTSEKTVDKSTEKKTEKEAEKVDAKTKKESPFAGAPGK